MIIIAGIPASGKSFFARWYAKKFGFEHFDVDLKGILPPLDDVRIRLILDWGFPMHQFATVAAVKSRGVEMWWFDGDRGAARTAFLRRASRVEQLSGARLAARLREFEDQMKAIENSEAEIAALFEKRIVVTIKSGPRYVSCEDIYSSMTTG